MSEKSPLHDITARAGAAFVEEAGWLMPDRYGDVRSEYTAARERVAVFDVSHRSKIEVTGGDALSFLQGLCTNDVAGLPVGAGCEVFLTTVQARVVGHALVYHLLLHDNRDALWLDAAPGLAEKLIKHLDH